MRDGSGNSVTSVINGINVNGSTARETNREDQGPLTAARVGAAHETTVKNTTENSPRWGEEEEETKTDREAMSEIARGM